MNRLFIIMTGMLFFTFHGQLAQATSSSTQPPQFKVSKNDAWLVTPTNFDKADFDNRLSDITQKIDKLSSETSAVEELRKDVDDVKRELTDSLMQISNALAIAESTISTANEAVTLSQSYLTYTSLCIAILAILGSVYLYKEQKSINQVEERVAQKLVRDLKSNGSGNSKSIIDEITAEVHDVLWEEAQETAQIVVRSEEFRENLQNYIKQAIQEELKTKDSSNTEISFL